MKKRNLLSLLLVLIMVFSFAGCGEDNKEKDHDSTVIVSFDTDGGSAVSPMEIKSGSKIAQPKDPVKEGFVFEKWTNNGKDFDFNTEIKESLILKANWKAVGDPKQDDPNQNNQNSNENKPDDKKEDNKKEENKQENVKVNSMSFDYNDAWALVNNSLDLGFKIDPADAKNSVKFSSSDEKIAKVDGNGVVIGSKGGNVIITAKAGDKEITCKVEIKEMNTGIYTPYEFYSTAYWAQYNTINLKAETVPKEHAYMPLSYSSSNPSVASVDDKGDVTGNGIGSATITISDGVGHTKDVEVYVNGEVLCYVVGGDIAMKGDKFSYDVFVQDFQNGEYIMTDMRDKVILHGNGDYADYLQLGRDGDDYVIECVKDAPGTQLETKILWFEVFKGEYSGLCTEDFYIYITAPKG